MEWAAIIALIVGILRIFKYHLLVLVVNWSNRIDEVKIKTKKSETIISKIKSNYSPINHRDVSVEQKVISIS
jgi:hypothetical protein